MKKLNALFLLILLSTLSYGQNWQNVSNALQRKIVGADTLYRFNMGAPGFWNISDKFGQYYTKVQSDARYSTLGSLSATSPIFYNSSTGVISSQAASSTLSGYINTSGQTIGGIKSFTATRTVFDGTLNLLPANGSFGSGYGGIHLGTTNLFGFKRADISSSANFDFGGLTLTRTYTFPNANGTVALTSDIPASLPTPNALTAGYGLSGSSFNGSAARTWTADTTSATGLVSKDRLNTALASKVTANSAITGATKAKITYDSKGLVTAGADLTESDIPSLSISKVTGLQDSLTAKANKNLSNVNTDVVQLTFGQEYLAYFQNKLLDGSPVKVMYSGDSTTDTVGTFVDPPFYITTLLRKFVQEKGISNVTIANRGHSGADSELWYNSYLTPDLAENPDLYIIRIGINDPYFGRDAADYEATLRAALTQIRATKNLKNLSVLLMVPNTISLEADGRDYAWLESISPILRELAREFKTGFIDTYHMWKDAKSGGNLYMDSLGVDISLHPKNVFNTWINDAITEMIMPPSIVRQVAVNPWQNGIVLTNLAASDGAIVSVSSGGILGRINAGVTNSIPKWSSEGALSNSIMTESFGAIIINGDASEGVTGLFKNSSSAGYGTKIQGGAATRYSFNVSDYADNPLFEVAPSYGTKIHTLAGTGDRLVVANSTGVLGAASIGSGLSYSGGILSATGGSAGTITGSGTAAYIARWNSSSDVGNSIMYESSGAIIVDGNTSEGVTSILKNASSTGYGTKIQGGAGSRYALLVADYADSTLFSVSTAGGGSLTVPLSAPSFAGDATDLTGTATALNIGGNAATATTATTATTAANSTLLQGYSPDIDATNSTVVLRTSAGYIFGKYLSQDSPNSEAGTISQLFYNNGTDGFLRKASIAQVQSAFSGIDATKLADGSVSNTELQYINTLSSNAQAQLNAKEGTITAGTTAQYYRGDKSWQTLDKTAVGLANVDNTSDAAKPVSTATQTALDLKANLASPALTGSPTAPTPTAGDNSTKVATTAYVQANAGKQLKEWYTDASNSSTTETDLYTYSVPGNTLVNNGDKLKFTISGNFSVTANNKTIKIYFGGSTFAFTAVTSSGGSWVVDGTIIKTSATDYRITLNKTETIAAASIFSSSGIVTNYTAANTFKITGTGGASNDIFATMGTLEFKPAAP